MSDLGRPFGQDFDLRRSINANTRRLDELEAVLGLVPIVDVKLIHTGQIGVFKLGGGTQIGGGGARIVGSPVSILSRGIAGASVQGTVTKGFADVLGDLTVSGDILPSADNIVRGIGSDVLPWNTLYASEIRSPTSINLQTSNLSGGINPRMYVTGNVDIGEIVWAQISTIGSQGSWPLVYTDLAATTPFATDTYDLGSALLRWASLYAVDVECDTINGAAPGGGTVTGTGTENALAKWSAGGTGVEDSSETDDGTTFTVGKRTAWPVLSFAGPYSGWTGDDIDFGDVTRILYDAFDGMDPGVNIQGITGGTDGRLLTLVNVSATAVIVLYMEAVTSTAANRIIGRNLTNIQIPVGGALTLLYDASVSRWRVISQQPPVGIAESANETDYAAGGDLTPFSATAATMYQYPGSAPVLGNLAFYTASGLGISDPRLEWCDAHQLNLYGIGNILPAAGALYDLGSLTLPWNALYVGDVECATINGAPVPGGTVAGSGTPTVFPVWDGSGNNLTDGTLYTDGSTTFVSGNDFALDSGKLTQMQGVTLAGLGLPALYDVQALTAQAGDITSTDFAGASVAGLYRVSYYLEDTVADLTAGTVSVAFSWVDSSGTTRTVTSAAVALSLISTGQASGSIFVELASGAISYSTSHTGIFGTAQYALFLTCERLS